MNPFAFYLLKVALCSGLLFGYYWLALRNKTFHQWNRLYLLGCVALSLLVPLLKIQIGSGYTPPSGQVFRMLHAISVDDGGEVESNSSPGFALTMEQWGWLAYALISAILFVVAAVSLIRIFRILHLYPKTKLWNACFLNTAERGTPFSFFRFIVWNRAIDLNTETGQRIFRHELAHVEQRHSWDKVFLLLILIPFWCNPFFWIIRKELHALHEFSADEKAVSATDATALAQMILNTAFPEQHFLFTNHLFQSTIKRRIAMFNKLKNPKVAYMGRIVALPVILLVAAAFAVKTTPNAGSPFTTLTKPLTVVIDAGHGGNSGATSGLVYEDDIVLALAKKIKEQNANSNVRILLTRGDNQNVDLKKRVAVAAENKADLFLSIHINAATPQDKTTNGMEVVISSKNPPYQQQSEILGSLLVQQLRNAYSTQANLIRKEVGIWVLDQNVCPSVLIECGYLTDKKDLAFITNEENQTLIATKILEAIVQYGVLKNSGKVSVATDTLPKRVYKNKVVTDVQYFEWPKKEVHVFLADGTKEAISVAEAFEANLFDSSTKSTIERKLWTTDKGFDSPPPEEYFSVRNISIDEARRFKGAVMLNDETMVNSFQDLAVLEKDIAYISVITGTAKVMKDEFGMKPGDSLLSITTSAFVKANRRTDNEPLFTQPEVEPKFPGDKAAWLTFLQKNLNPDVAVNNSAPSGTYKVIVGFIVDVDGKLHDIKPVTKLGYGMEGEVVRLMKTSPDWIPAMQNRKKVTAYKKQTVTFVISEGE